MNNFLYNFMSRQLVWVNYIFARMNKLLMVLTLCISASFGSSNAFAQKKFIGKFFSNGSDTSRSTSFLALPVLGYSQETGFEFGAVSLYSFYTNRLDTLTRASRITGVTTFTTKSQSNFQLKSDIWSPGNRYHYASEFRYKNFPFNFYGIGNETLKSDEDRITQKLFRINAGIEKQIGRITYIGLNASYESYQFTDKEPGGIFATNPSIQDRDGGKVFFFGISQIIDNRNSNTYTTKGSYIKLNYSYAPKFFGPSDYNGGMFRGELRTFKGLSKKIVLGINGLFQTIADKNTPFYLLPQLGNDEIMRGYYSGRYRDNNLLAMQAELRLRLNQRIGLVGFGGMGSVFGKEEINMANLKPSVGGGFRYFFDVQKGLSIRMDYAVGEKRTGEDRQKGFYLSLGESF